jgi:hypothetical protein
LTFLGHWGQLDSWFKAAYTFTGLFCFSYELYRYARILIFANYCCQKEIAPSYLGFLGSHIEYSMLHTYALLLTSFTNKKQTNP